MTKQNVIKKIKTFLPYIIITIFVLVFAFSNSTFAKYMGTTSDASEAVAGDFYFTSVLLQEIGEDADGDEIIEQVELYGSGESFIVNLYNTFEGKESAMDITFQVVVSGNATISLNADKSSVNTEDSPSYENIETSDDKKTITGTMLAGTSHIAIEVFPTFETESTTEVINITATSTAPYTKTLSADFTSLNPEALSGDVIGTQTVLHENYTELLVVSGSEFKGDVYVIIGDYATITTKFFPRDLEVAKCVKFYYPGDDGYSVPTDNDGNPVVYSYVDSLASTSDDEWDYTNAIFYIELAEVFDITGEDYLKPNRTYVIDFLGEMQVNTSELVGGGIIYDDNTEGVNSAMVFLTTAEWVNTESYT